MDRKEVSGAGIGLVMGTALGYLYGMMVGNIALWMPIGTAFGLIFGGAVTVTAKRRAK